MTIERIDSQQTSVAATAEIDGKTVQVALASVNIRPGKMLSINVNVTDEISKVDDAGRAAIMQLFSGYMAGEITKAAGLGIPVALPEQ